MKVLIGLAAALLIAWVWHGPLGHGERLIANLERQARATVADTRVAGIGVAFRREPLARAAVLSGPANDFQREGMGSQPGISDLVREIDGVGSVRWSDEPDRNRWAVPLLLETAGLAAVAYFIGLGLGWLLWGRPRRERFGY